MAADTLSLAGATGAPAWPRGRPESGLSIVVPLFNEAAGLRALHARVAEVARRLKDTRKLTTEVIYVDDGSRDATLAIAHALVSRGQREVVLCRRRNTTKCDSEKFTRKLAPTANNLATSTGMK